MTVKPNKKVLTPWTGPNLTPIKTTNSEQKVPLSSERLIAGIKNTLYTSTFRIMGGFDLLLPTGLKLSRILPVHPPDPPATQPDVSIGHEWLTTTVRTAWTQASQQWLDRTSSLWATRARLHAELKQQSKQIRTATIRLQGLKQPVNKLKHFKSLITIDQPLFDWNKVHKST